MWWREHRDRRALLSLSYKGTNPVIRAPLLRPNYLLKASSPNTIMLGIRVSVYEFAACMCRLRCFSCVWLFAALDRTHQVLPSTRFSRKEYWSGLPCPPSGGLPDPAIEPALAGEFFTATTTWEAHEFGGGRVVVNINIIAKHKINKGSSWGQAGPSDVETLLESAISGEAWRLHPGARFY